eukprot:m.11490 g.11490  ORF g.11490 m.11490 type:complete len:745 (+) comp23428_c0_seq1:1429-3663(+)
MSFLSAFICLLVVTASVVKGAHLPALVNIDYNGIKGVIRINATEGSGTVAFDFHDLHTYNLANFVNMTAAIHQLPAPYRSKCQPTATDVGLIYDPTDAMSGSNYTKACQSDATKCAVGDLGLRLGKINHESNGDVLKTVFPGNNWYLSGSDGIVGRTLVLYNYTGYAFACGIIERHVIGSKKEVIRKSLLIAPVGGEVTFRQVIDTKTGQRFDAQIIVDLFYVDGSNTSSGHGWYLDDGQISSDANCAALNSAPATNAGCSRTNQAACSQNDLTGKHGTLSIHSGKGLHYFFIDTNLEVDTFVQKAVAVTDVKKSTSLSCGNVYNEDLQLGARFDGAVKGTVMFKPAIGGSIVSVNLTNMNSTAGTYHIHVYPVQNGDCMTTGGHMNPFGIKGTPQNGSADMYEVGDLSGIFGKFSGKNHVVFQKFSSNLKLTGRFGVLGRSIVIHSDKDGSRWQCANIVPMAPGTKKLTSLAKFVGKFEGMVKMIQWQLGDGRLTDTMVDIDIKSVGESETKNHNWHVHNRPAASFPGFGSKNCASAFTSGHYNPYDVDLGDNYKSECSVSNPLRCELGDLSGKHEKYNIFPKTAKAGRGYSSDPNLPLMGPLSVIGHSIVIHAENAGGPRISCASLYPENHKFFSVLFKKPSTINEKDIQSSIAQGLKVSADEVKFLSVNTDEESNCTSATFVVADGANVPDGNFSSIVSDGNFGNYKVDDDCLSEMPTNTAACTAFSIFTLLVILLVKNLL